MSSRNPASDHRSRDFGRTVATLLVLAVGLNIHLLYFLSAPVMVMNDSVGYVRAAQGILESLSLAKLDAVRTPGYPIFLASLFGIYGDSIASVAFVQHVLIAVLGPLVTYLLSARVRPSLAVATGIGIVLDPFLALFASWILTEAVFAVLISLSVLLLMSKQDSKRMMLVSGLIIGLATLVRPNGLIVLPAVVLLMLLTMALQKESKRALAEQLLLLVIGTLVMLSPWLAYRYDKTGDLSLARNESGFLRVQMLQHQRLFEPGLLHDDALISYYHQLKMEREKDSEEEKLYRRGFAFVFKDHLLETRSPEEVEQLYQGYLERYMASYFWKYAEQSLMIFQSLLHLNRFDGMSVVVAKRYLNAEISLENHIASIANDEEHGLLYAPHDVTSLSTAWTTLLEFLFTVKPILAILFLGFCLVSVRLLFSGHITVMTYLPVVIIVSQALAYALFLHHDDRYTLVLTPLMFIQVALLTDAWCHFLSGRR